MTDRPRVAGPLPFLPALALPALAAGEEPTPSSADGPPFQRVLDAVAHSAATRSTWTEIPR